MVEGYANVQVRMPAALKADLVFTLERDKLSLSEFVRLAAKAYLHSGPFWTDLIEPEEC